MTRAVRGVVLGLAMWLGTFTVLYLVTNLYVGPVLIVGEEAGTPAEELAILRGTGGPMWPWPGTRLSATPAEDGTYLLERRWLGWWEARVLIGPADSGWQYLSEERIGPAQGIQTAFVALVALAIAVPTSVWFDRRRTRGGTSSSGASDKPPR